MSINPILMSTGCLSCFLESYIHFPELFIELLERLGFLARCPKFMMYFHACSIWTVAITSLFISLRSCCFLCSLFVSCIVYLYPEVHYFFPNSTYLLSVFSMLIFPNSFFPVSPSFFQGSEFLCIFPCISPAPLFPCLFR